jgi:hypothetical protein
MQNIARIGGMTDLDFGLQNRTIMLHRVNSCIATFLSLPGRQYSGLLM